MSTGRTAGVLAVTAIGISLLIWAGVHNGREQELKRQQAQQTPEVALVRKGTVNPGMDPGMAMPPEPMPALQGKIAPGFTLVDVNGKKVSLADYKGKPVMVNFWATWCGPCKLEMPWLEEFHKKYAGDGLVILGVAADDAGKDTIEGTAIKLGVTYPILLADDKVETAYGGVDQLPESFYVGRDGKIAVQTSGTYDGQDGKDAIEANLKKLLAPASAPADAGTPGHGAGR